MTSAVVLSYGLGVDSTAILMRWLHEPASRDFDLADLVVVTAMTGDEWPESGQLVEQHLLPMLRAHNIRYIQVARATGSQTDGIVVLDDSRQPWRLHLQGAYKLSEEMLAAGTVPQMGGVRKCSQKAKGWPLDLIIERTLGKGVAFRHVIGFEANEPQRAAKDRLANTAVRTGEYPLIEWGWDRGRCEDYIHQLTGINWWKSACVYCPFALSNKAGRLRVLQQYRDNAAAAADALFVEHVSLLLNPRQGLNGDVRLVDLLRADGNLTALRALNERLANTEHALYEVRRLIRARKDDPTRAANAARSVRKHAIGSRTEMRRLLDSHGHAVDDRVWLHHRTGTLPATEHVFVVAPNVVAEKTSVHFEDWWRQALVEVA